MNTTTGVPITPAELRAVEDHKYFLSLERGSEVSIEEAITDFAQRIAAAWRRDKARADALAQLHEIDVRRLARSAEEGREVTRAEFAIEWCTHHAEAWRAERESLANNALLRMAFAPPDATRSVAVHGSTVASTLAPFDCDAYVHGRGVSRSSFVLEGRSFAHAKSVRTAPALEAAADAPLEFIATGSHADRALAALREFFGQLPLVDATP